MNETFEGKRRRAIRAVDALGEFDRAELARLFGCDGRSIAAALKATAAKKSPARKPAKKTAARNTGRRR